ncbi:Uncharacterized protein Adt_14091 [Abeliophyllum distichum]|uniref:Transposase (putative) gypsy type domain-containing protein n=1 Tax=Abeliophyllum distichum TaxID=126358 RepID=A0ABD1TYN4_9LAMI
MSKEFTVGEASGRMGKESDVLPIRGLDTSTGKEMAIASAPRLTKGEDSFKVDPVKWAALDVPSIMVEEDLKLLRNAYKVPSDIDHMLPEPKKSACFLRRGCTALHLHVFVGGMRTSLHPFFWKILRVYGLAPNGWIQMVGGLYLWFRHSFGLEMPMHVFQTIYQPRKLSKKKGREEELG